jgi:hypothetical protein
MDNLFDKLYAWATRRGDHGMKSPLQIWSVFWRVLCA